MAVIHVDVSFIKPIIKKILEQSWGVILSILATLAVLIFSSGFRAWAGADEFVTNYRAPLCIALLFFSSYLACMIAASIIAKAKRRRLNAKWEEARSRHKRSL
jgi:hypothetical protein